MKRLAFILVLLALPVCAQLNPASLRVLLGAAQQQLPTSGGGGFVLHAVTYNGAANMTRGANLNSIADSKVGTLSVWINPAAASDGNGTAILYTDNGNIFRILKLSDDTMHIQAGTASAVNMDFQTTTTFTSSGGWKNLLISWDLSAGVIQCYINDTVETPSSGGPPGVNANCTYSGLSNWAVGDLPSGGAPFTGCISELYFDPTTHYDLSIVSSRRQFIHLGNHPAGDLSGVGTPAVYFKGSFASPGLNSGTGGNFTPHGTFTSCTTP